MTGRRNAHTLGYATNGRRHKEKILLNLHRSGDKESEKDEEDLRGICEGKGEGGLLSPFAHKNTQFPTRARARLDSSWLFLCICNALMVNRFVVCAWLYGIIGQPKIDSKTLIINATQFAFRDSHSYPYPPKYMHNPLPSSTHTPFLTPWLPYFFTLPNSRLLKEPRRSEALCNF